MNLLYRMEQKGITIIQSIWFSFITRIVNKVIEEIGLDNEQAQIIRNIYLIPGNFKVLIRDSS